MLLLISGNTTCQCRSITLLATFAHFHMYCTVFLFSSTVKHALKNYAEHHGVCDTGSTCFCARHCRGTVFVGKWRTKDDSWLAGEEYRVCVGKGSSLNCIFFRLGMILDDKLPSVMKDLDTFDTFYNTISSKSLCWLCVHTFIVLS